MRLVGREKVDYFSRKKNAQVTGVSIHCEQKKDYDPNCEGTITSTEWVDINNPLYNVVMGFPLNSEIDIIKNSRGFLEHIQLKK